MRGLLAVGVMVYHVLAWSDVARLTALGTYAVYCFFVLSGFALEHVYGPRLRVAGALRAYAAARVARILPLYAAAALAAAALVVARGGRVDVFDLLQNLTLTFGLNNPGATSTVVGGWSIGIEVVFYLLFPFVSLMIGSLRSLAVLVAVTLLARVAWIAATWPVGASLADVFVPYTQVIPFAVFFAAGVLSARLLREPRLVGPLRDRRRGLLSAIVGVGLLAAIIATAALDVAERTLFAGLGGAVLTIATCLAVYLVALAPQPAGRAAAASRILGDASYGTYLLHPIVFGILTLAGVDGPLRLALTFTIAPACAIGSYRLFEKPVGRYLRRRMDGGTAESSARAAGPVLDAPATPS
jgi:peptidoglycan/LPS O-acetylase OafA/YrhL